MNNVLSVLAVLGVLLSGGAAAGTAAPAEQAAPAALQTADLPADASAVLLSGAASGPVCTVPYCTDPAHCHTYAAARYCRNRLTGYGRHHWYAADTVQAPAQEPLFWNCMGCTDPACTDPTHFHHCAAGCTVAEHYHDCPAGCTVHDHGYHHQTAVPATTSAPEPLFWNSMGCTDPACTDPAHFHHCAAGCTVAGHYHDCPAGCTAHNHGGWQQGHGSGHHGGGHHGWS